MERRWLLQGIERESNRSVGWLRHRARAVWANIFDTQSPWAKVLLKHQALSTQSNQEKVQIKKNLKSPIVPFEWVDLPTVAGPWVDLHELEPVPGVSDSQQLRVGLKHLMKGDVHLLGPELATGWSVRRDVKAHHSNVAVGVQYTLNLI